jgi:microcystin-dependent protein
VLAFGQACTGTYPVLRALLVAAGSPFGTNGVDPLFPDCRSRRPVGKSNMGGVDNGLWTGGTVLGAIAGAQGVVLSTTQIPSHLHSVFLNDPGHFHGMTLSNAGTSTGGTNTMQNTGTTNTGSKTTGITVRDQAGGAGTQDQTATAGGGLTHENRQPSIILNKIVKAH